MVETAYKVTLEQFHGPLDLLLFLIKSQEIDIYDIPVAKVADQYLSYLDTLSVLDINIAGDFLVLAATLVELKSKVLLPLEAGEDKDGLEDVEDPRSDLVRKLLEYKRFRDLAESLEQLREDNQARYVRGGTVGSVMGRPDSAPVAGREGIDDEGQEDLGIEATLWELLAAFHKLMREVAQSAPATILYDETPISAHMQRLLGILRDRRVAKFIDLFEGRRDRGFIIGTFLALLELCKLRALYIEDGEGFDLLLRYAGGDEFELPDGLTTTYEAGPPPPGSADEFGVDAVPSAPRQTQEDGDDHAGDGWSGGLFADVDDDAAPWDDGEGDEKRGVEDAKGGANGRLRFWETDGEEERSTEEE